jgi:hypothetical protein
MLLQRLSRRAAAILIVCLIGTNVSYVAAQTHIPGKSELGGWVYIDKNNDGQVNFANEPNPEWMIPNVVIELYTQSNPSTPFKTTQTDTWGRYFFGNLDPGTYGLKQIQPVQYVDGIDTYGVLQALTNQGVPPGTPSGTASTDAFSGIVLPANVRGDHFNFGERGWALGYASKRFLEGFAPLMEFGVDVPAVVIPEPATIWLATAAFGLGLATRRRRRP